MLTTGGAVITQTFPIPSGDYPGAIPPADYQDDSDEGDDSEGIAPTPDDGTGDIEDDQDPSWYPNGDDVDSGARDGWDLASDAGDQASNELPDGNWVIVSAFDPPVATDASGQSVPVSLAKTSGGLTVSISPSSSAVFPIQVNLSYGFDPGSYDPPASDSAPTRIGVHSAMARAASVGTSAQAPTACSGRAEIVVSSGSGSKFLTDAFRRWSTPCANYDVSVAPKGNVPRVGSVAKIKALNTKKVKSLRSRFIPIAQISFKSIPTSDYQEVGNTFAKRMRQLGYGMWSIDEFYGFNTDPSFNVTRWNNYSDLVYDLSRTKRNGAISEKKVISKGIIFNAVLNHESIKANIPGMKARWKMLLSDPAHYDWNAPSPTKLWADEDYTKCSVVCVSGSKLRQKATYTNAYMQKFARLAFASDAPVTAPADVTPARTFLETRFGPLINGWGAVSRHGNGKNSYGTFDMGLGQIERLVGLQVYAARSWIENAKPKPPYGGLRIGVRWTDWAPSGKKRGEDWSNHWGQHQRAQLAMWIAKSIRGAYSRGGQPIDACVTKRGTNSEGCQATDPRATDFTQAKVWNTFRKWGGTGCQRPSNNDFADATTITGSEGSINGTTECATWESGETSPYGEGTRSVWYRWDAPATEYGKFARAVDSNNGYLETNLYTGDSLGHLTQAPFPCGASPGGTYWIQVVDRLGWGGGDAPAGPFTLSWGTAGCYN